MDIKDFGDITASRACDGLGMSGLTTSQIGFSVYGDFYASRAATVELSGVGDLPKYYIATRSTSNGVTQITCYDRMAFSDTEFPYSDFTSNVIPIADVLQKIADACGVNKCTGVPPWIGKLPKTKLQGTCADIMSNIAEAACGFWRVSADNNYEFVPFGSISGTMVVNKHSPLNIGNSYSVKGVKCTDGNGRIYIAGNDTFHSYDGIIIGSDLINEDSVGEIWSRVNGDERIPINCEKSIVEKIPEINTLVTFGQGGDYVINNISCSISAGGIVAHLQGNAPSGDEIGTRGIISRKLSNAVQVGKQTGNQIVTAYQGIVYKSGGAYGG